MEYITTTEQETEALAETLAARLKPGDVLAFRGGLGAGKTAFVRGLARGLHVSGQVSSPTFALVHEYGGAVPLYHFDMYRVEDWQSLYSTGFFDYLDSGGILAVEWSENIENALPEGTITVTIETLGGDNRRITWEGEDA
jgi:tRNA threonylcarbamoyladenosine biosynthesis protein TsaE